MIVVSGKPYLKVFQTQTGYQVVDLSGFLSGEWLIDVFKAERQSFSEDGEIIIDEVVLPKENTSKVESMLTYYTSQKRVLQGQEYLILIWTKGKRTMVIGIKKVVRSENKMQMSIELVEEYLKEGIPTKGLRCDGWFFSEEFVKRLKDRVEIVSRPKKNLVWYIGADKIKVKDYGAKVLPSDGFHYYSKQGVYARGIILYHKKYGECKVVIVKPKRSSPSKDWRLIVCTNLQATVREIVQAMRTRWKIEVVFRDCSQNLGLKSNQTYKPGSSERHVAMVFLAYNFLAEIREKEGGTIGRIKRKLADSWNQERTMFLAEEVTYHAA